MNVDLSEMTSLRCRVEGSGLASRNRTRWNPLDQVSCL